MSETLFVLLLAVLAIGGVVMMAVVAIHEVRHAHSAAIVQTADSLGGALERVVGAMYQPAGDVPHPDDASRPALVMPLVDIPDWANENIDPTDALFPTREFRSSYVVPEGMDPITYLTGGKNLEVDEPDVPEVIDPEDFPGAGLAGEVLE